MGIIDYINTLLQENTVIKLKLFFVVGMKSVGPMSIFQEIVMSEFETGQQLYNDTVIAFTHHDQNVSTKKEKISQTIEISNKQLKH